MRHSPVSARARFALAPGSLGRDCLAAEGPGPVDEAVALPKDVVVIVGPSGVGKSTLIGKLMGDPGGGGGAQRAPRRVDAGEHCPWGVGGGSVQDADFGDRLWPARISISRIGP